MFVLLIVGKSRQQYIQQLSMTISLFPSHQCEMHNQNLHLDWFPQNSKFTVVDQQKPAKKPKISQFDLPKIQNGLFCRIDSVEVSGNPSLQKVVGDVICIYKNLVCTVPTLFDGVLHIY